MWFLRNIRARPRAPEKKMYRSFYVIIRTQQLQKSKNLKNTFDTIDLFIQKINVSTTDTDKKNQITAQTQILMELKNTLRYSITQNTSDNLTKINNLLNIR